MIALLSGTPIIEGTTLIVQVQGVGYGVSVSSGTLAACAGQPTITLHIYTAVRDDAIELYGFQSAQEKALFLLLLSVSGVGPRTALTITQAAPTQIIAAVQHADVSFFTAIPRVGKKLAQKIIIELTSKLGTLQELDLSPLTTTQQTVADALLSLGFSEEDSRAAAREYSTDEQPVEKIIQQALKQLSAAK